METYNYYKGLSLIDLASISEAVIGKAKEDIVELSTLGVTETLLDNALEQIVAVRAVHTHAYVRGLKVATTKERVESAKVLKQTMTELSAQTMFVDSIGQGEHAIAFCQGLSKKDPEGLIQTATSMYQVLTNSSEDLSLYGLTSERIAEFKAQIDDLYSKTVNQKSKRVGLSVFTQERTKTRNDLAKLLKFISTVGQAYWKKRNFKKYEEYVISKYDLNSMAKAKGESSQPADNQEGKTFQIVS